ncbi:MAG: FAD:protein FMN transferase [bacterium]
MSRRTVLLVAALALACAGPVTRKRAALLMDTFVTVTVIAPRDRADRALDAVFARLDEISRKFNHLDSTSPVYAFNTRGEPIVDIEVVSVLKVVVEMSALSGGAFDVTVEPLVRLWGFYGDSPAVPSRFAVESCLQFVGYHNLVVESTRVTKTDSRTRVDLGGIAKGYALSEAARVLRSFGVQSALVDAGGDIYAVGAKGERDWMVGIRRPRGEGIAGVVTVRDGAVVTSGDYERYFFGPDSVRYCHIIDPRTGRPAQGIISTTVRARDPVTGQALAKALFILGPERFGALGLPVDVEWLAIDESLSFRASPNLELTGVEPAFVDSH